ncbi:hypothetical protein [Pontibacter sp. SGAir0037]|uniref:hypothetical protein n=1 Tax=Pontibacter sp. SGAir0037 TaxID=2571030 RepID=UPI0010CD4B36|nr:hypothetical protein [Pontibacter sp. SGAir0037]QCR23798.1 hypothetical protein C1N53_16535 [Pontibacter sp. SGAir0037]
MNKSTLNFWLLFIISLVISALAVSVFIKVLKLIIYVILVLALAPVVYLLLKLILPGRKTKDDKLKTRD